MNLSPDLKAELVRHGLDPDSVIEVTIVPEYHRSAGRYVHPGIDAEPWNEKMIATGRIEIRVLLADGQRATLDVYRR
jgi:hypothetical protein